MQLATPLLLLALAAAPLAVPASGPAPASARPVLRHVGTPGLPPQGGALKPALMIVCTPDTVAIGNEPPRQVRNPMVAALEAAGPGSRITLRPGDYPSFGIGFRKATNWNARTSGGRPGLPVVVEGQGRAVIRAGKDSGDAITINQEIANGHFLFRNLEIEPGYRAAVMFYKQKGGKSHDGFRFHDCDIIGGYDHAAGQGKRSKWGVWAHSLRDFEFRGVTRPAEIRDIQQEHAFYLQNPRGDILIERVRAQRLGRTFCQFTARAKDGPPGIGNIVVRDCEVEDIGLSRWDGYKGGSAFTVAGRITGSVTFEGNSYRAGFDRALRELTNRSAPYGTGALVCWDGHEKQPNGLVVLRDNRFEFAEGCGDRPVVSIGGCRDVRILGNNRFVAGSDLVPALALDPVGDRRPGGKPTSRPNGQVHVAESTLLVGSCTLRGVEATEAELAQLAEPPAGSGERGRSEESSADSARGLR